MAHKSTALFLSHGGGPLPLLGDPGHTQMLSSLRNIAAEIPRPTAIVVVSAHWEAEVPSITASAAPELIYDYYGFPEESYQISYPCPGHPALATQLQQLLDNAGIDSQLDAARGFDHGLFIPLKIMYPDADIPCVQLSLVDSLDAQHHIDIGRALRSLQDQNVLLIGSGFSFHNLPAFFSTDTPQAREHNLAFENWLGNTCCDTNISEHARAEALINWEQADGARYCHPREEHLLPLHVCYGAAGKACTQRFELQIMNKQASMFLW